MSEQPSALVLRDALVALRHAPQQDTALEAGVAEKIVARIRTDLATTLERPPVVAFAVADGTGNHAVEPGGIAWAIAAEGNRAVVEVNAPALAIIVAQMFGAPAATVVETPALPPRPLETRLAAVVAAIVVSAVGAIAGEGATLRLGQPVATGEDLPPRLAISLSAYGVSGTITVNAAAPFGGAGTEAAVDHLSRAAWTDGMARAVAGIGVPSRVVLALPRSTLGEIARWRPGHTIALPGSGALVATIMAGARPLAAGELGRDGRQYCVRVAGFPPSANKAAGGRASQPFGDDER